MSLVVLASYAATPAIAKDCGDTTGAGSTRVACDCGDRITTSYTLLADLDCSSAPVGQHGLIVDATEITLDGGGHTIYGPTGVFHNTNDDEVGIKVESGSFGAVVKNVTVRGGDIGQPGTTTGTWKRCIEVKAQGVTIGDDATQVVVENCGRCGFIGSYGIDVSGEDATVKNSVVRYVGDEGIHVGSGSHNARVLNNTVIMNDETDPTPCGEGLEAIYLLSNTGALVAGNQTSKSKSGGWGLHMKDASHARIENNSFLDRGATLRGDSDYNTLSGNLFHRRLSIVDRSEDVGGVPEYFFPTGNRIYGGVIDALDLSDHCLVLENAENNRAQSVSMVNSIGAAVHTIAAIEAGKGIYEQPETWPVNTLTAVTVDGSPLEINDVDLGGDDVEFEYGTVIIHETPGTPVTDAIAVADGYIWSGASSGSVFSSETTTVAKVTGGCNGHERVSLFKFGILPTSATGAIDATLKVISPINMSAAHGGLLHAVDPAANAVAEASMSWSWFETEFGAGLGEVAAAVRQETPVILQPGAAAEVYTSYDVTQLFQLESSLDSVMFSISGDPVSGVLARYYSKETAGKQPKLSYTPVTATQHERPQVPPLDPDCSDDICSDFKEAYVRSSKPKESNGDKPQMTITLDNDGAVYESYLTFDVSNVGTSARQTARLYLHVRCLPATPFTCFTPNTGFGPKVYVLDQWDTATGTEDDGWEQGTGDADVTDPPLPHPDWIHWDVRPDAGDLAGQLVLATDSPYTGEPTDGYWWVVELSHALADELPLAGSNGKFTLMLVGANDKLIRFDGMRNHDNDGKHRPRLVLGPVGTPIGQWPP